METTPEKEAKQRKKKSLDGGTKNRLWTRRKAKGGMLEDALVKSRGEKVQKTKGRLPEELRAAGGNNQDQYSIHCL
jgi:hypothetical protein